MAIITTRMQQRRGTAAQWSDANPILSPAEFGFETDTGKFKIGNGGTRWNTLKYFQNASEVADALVAGAPGTLNTLNELAAAINDDATVYQTILTSIEAAVQEAKDYADSLATDYDPAGSALAAKGDAEIFTSAAVATHENKTTGIHGIIDTSQLALKGYVDSATATSVSDHNSDSTDVHGIANTANLATKAYADAAVAAHEADTTNVHGILDTSALATKTYADDAASTAKSGAESTAASALSAHDLDTTDIHGIADTAELATKTYVNSAVAAVIDSAPTTLDTLNELSAALGDDANFATTVADSIGLKAPIASPTFTGTVTAPTLNSNAGTITSSVLKLNQVFSPKEKVHILASTTGNRTIDVDNGSIYFYSGASPEDFLVNITRGTENLATTLAQGESITVTAICENGATPRSITGINIDGLAAIPQWQGGNTPNNVGNDLGRDAYTFTAIKTGPTSASPNWVLLASYAPFK